MSCLLKLAGALAAIALASAAQAGAVWSMNASGCRASDAAIQASSYATSDGIGVGFRGNAGLTIVMYCPVLTVGQDRHTGRGSTINFLSVSGHPAENGPTITAQLVRVSKNTGLLSNVGSPVTLVWVDPGVLLQKTVQLTHQFDFTQFFYFVRVDIVRTDSKQIAFYVVQMFT